MSITTTVEIESRSWQGVLNTLCDKVVSDLRQVGDFPHVIWFPPPIKLTAMIYILSVENMNLDMTLNGILLYIRVSSNKKIQQTCNFKYSRLILILHGMKNNIIVEKLLNSMEDNKSSMIEQTSPLAPLKLLNIKITTKRWWKSRSWFWNGKKILVANRIPCWYLDMNNTI